MAMTVHVDVVSAEEKIFSGLAEFVALAGHLCADKGVLVAMKGVYPFEELSQIRAPYKTTAVIPIAVPGLGAERHLVMIERQDDP